MGGFEHHGLPAAEQENEAVAAQNARRGMLLFLVYLALYGGFVGLNAFAPDVMDRAAWAGLNLAVVYGFGLIVAALVLALVYGWLCRTPRQPPPDPFFSADPNLPGPTEGAGQ